MPMTDRRLRPSHWPRRAVAYLNLGDAYVKLGRKPDTKKAFEKFLEIQPTSKSASYAQEMITSLQ